jgi:hypothetical protein
MDPRLRTDNLGQIAARREESLYICAGFVDYCRANDWVRQSTWRNKCRLARKRPGTSKSVLPPDRAWVVDGFVPARAGANYVNIEF